MAISACSMASCSGVVGTPLLRVRCVTRTGVVGADVLVAGVFDVSFELCCGLCGGLCCELCGGRCGVV